MKHKISFITTFVTFIALIGSAASFAGFKDSQVAFKSGNWQVFRSIDPMNDTIKCTGIYKDNYSIQLASDKLFVVMEIGPESYTLRFGDKPAKPSIFAREMEKQLRSIIISDKNFSELIESDRLRLESLTLVNGIVNYDLDLTGIKDAVKSINASCPIQAVSTPTASLEKPSRSLSDKAAQPVCTDLIISRMKAQSIKEKQIRAICK